MELRAAVAGKQGCSMSRTAGSALNTIFTEARVATLLRQAADGGTARLMTTSIS